VNERRELFRRANVSLAISAPILFAGAIFLRNANEAVVQTFALAWFFLPFAIFFVLDERSKRRGRRDQ